MMRILKETFPRKIKLQQPLRVLVKKPRVYSGPVIIPLRFIDASFILYYTTILGNRPKRNAGSF
jgi:hypothetical protein